MPRCMLPQTRGGGSIGMPFPCADIMQQEVAKGMDDSLLPRGSGTRRRWSAFPRPPCSLGTWMPLGTGT